LRSGAQESNCTYGTSVRGNVWLQGWVEIFLFFLYLEVEIFRVEALGGKK
jgi:hypothetical protein